MTMTAPKPLKPLEEALADLDTPEAISDRKHRALEWAKRLVDPERSQMINTAGRLQIDACYEPLRNVGAFKELRPEAEKMTGRNFDQLVQQLCEDHLRRQDEQAVHNDPDRVEAIRVWQMYCSLVSSIAWQEGNQSDAWVTRWRDLIQRRNDAEAYGDDTGAIDRSLERMKVPYPKLPGAAWLAADTLSESERTAEYERLTVKYGARHPEPTKRTRK